MRRTALALSLALCLPASGADAVQSRFCMEPTAPISFLRRPALPYCASSRSCDQFEVNTYNQALTRFRRQLVEYAEQVDRYYRTAGEYIECMSN